MVPHNDIGILLFGFLKLLVNKEMKVMYFHFYLQSIPLNFE